MINNKVELNGNWAKPFIYKISKKENGELTYFLAGTLAVTDYSEKVNNKGEKPTDFFNIVAFGKSAYNIYYNQFVGDESQISGKLKNKKYQKGNGTFGYSVEIIVNEVKFLKTALRNQGVLMQVKEAKKNGRIPEYGVFPQSWQIDPNGCLTDYFSKLGNHQVNIPNQQGNNMNQQRNSWDSHQSQNTDYQWPGSQQTENNWVMQQQQYINQQQSDKSQMSYGNNSNYSLSNNQQHSYLGQSYQNQPNNLNNKFNDFDNNAYDRMQEVYNNMDNTGYNNFQDNGIDVNFSFT